MLHLVRCDHQFLSHLSHWQDLALQTHVMCDLGQQHKCRAVKVETGENVSSTCVAFSLLVVPVVVHVVRTTDVWTVWYLPPSDFYLSLSLNLSVLFIFTVATPRSQCWIIAAGEQIPLALPFHRFRGPTPAAARGRYSVLPFVRSQGWRTQQ